MRPETSPHPFGDLLRQIDLLLPPSSAGPGSDRSYADVVADLLAFLAERMTALHEERQEEARAFLGWIEERIGVSIDDLSGKTMLRSYDEQPGGAEEFLAVLERNRSKIEIDISHPEGYRATNPHRERMVEGYEKSMARLRPIRRQIELTDELIDRIVYCLYDLTDEEIDLVESS